MSVSEPLLLIGARRRAALREAFVACVNAWRKEWTTAADPVRVLLAEEVEHGGSRSGHAVCMSMKSATHGKLAWIQAEHDALPGWLGVAAHTEPNSLSSHAVAREFQVEMTRALCTTLARRARVDDATVECTSGTERPDRRCRSLAVTIQMGSSRAKTTLLLTPRLVELLVPPRSGERSSATLGRRRPAIAEERVSVEAVLGDAEVSLRDLAQLAVDDVIVLDRPLRAGGRLTMPDGTNVASIALGRSGERRAISINKRS
jgi:flagellar motor switch/type III secretory pathway protein FliN